MPLLHHSLHHRTQVADPARRPTSERARGEPPLRPSGGAPRSRRTRSTRSSALWPLLAPCTHPALAPRPQQRPQHRSGTLWRRSGTLHASHAPSPQPDQVRGTDGQRCTPRTANAEQAIQRGDGLLTASSCQSTIYLHPHGCLSRSTRTQATCQLLYSQSVAIPAMRCRRRVALHCFPPSSPSIPQCSKAQRGLEFSCPRCVCCPYLKLSEGDSRVCVQSYKAAVYLCYSTPDQFYRLSKI